jgi:hypothetical protein
MGQWKNVENNWQGLCAAVDTGAPSDDRLKTGLAPLRDALSAVLRLRGVRYRWSSAAVEHYTRDIPQTLSAGPDATPEENERVWAAERAKTTGELAGEHIGLVAQDVEAVVPELVYDDPDGYKRLRYGHLTALLVEAVKEQQATIDALAARLNGLQRA